jgi:hypothetical protein
MKNYMILWLLFPLAVVAQKKHSIKTHDFEGVIDKYVASGVAYDLMLLRTGKSYFYIKFDSRSGKEVLEKFPVGTQVSGVARGRSIESKFFGRLSVFLDFLADSLVSLNGAGHRYTQVWIPRKDFVHHFDPTNHSRRSILLDHKIVRTASQSSYSRMLYIDKSTVLVSPNNSRTRQLTKGDVVSAIIQPIELMDGEVYTVSEFKSAYHAEILQKFEGSIESFLYNQNTACTGMRVGNGRTSSKFQFPSHYAQQIMEWQKREEPILVYYRPLGMNLVTKNVLTTKYILSNSAIQAIISGSDTLRFTDNYFGSSDNKHEYEPSINNGKISDIKVSLAGKTYGIVVDEKYFLEIDRKTEAQLKKYFRKRLPISFEGKRLVKKPGEVYEGNYEVITPTKLTIEGKEFLLTNP